MLFNLIRRELETHILRKSMERFESKIGIDCFCTIAGKASEVVDFARFTGFNNEAHGCTQAFADQMMMNGCCCEKCGQRNPIRSDHTI